MQKPKKTQKKESFKKSIPPKKVNFLIKETRAIVQDQEVEEIEKKKRKDLHHRNRNQDQNPMIQALLKVKIKIANQKSIYKNKSRSDSS